jgi:hypothetical protein
MSYIEEGVIKSKIGGVLHMPLRGLSRKMAAAYIGCSPTKFDELVKDGRMPQPRCIDSRRIWDIVELDEGFEELPQVGAEKSNPWDLI